MKRLGLCAFVWVLFVGGVTLYMGHRHSAMGQPATAMALRTVDRTYLVEVTTSFTAEADPFALRTDTSEEAPALLLRLGDTELLRLSDGVVAGQPRRLEAVQGLTRGSNELFVKATPPTALEGRQFVQLRVLQGGQSLAETVLWSEGGAAVAGSLRFVLEEDEEDGHEH